MSDPYVGLVKKTIKRFIENGEIITEREAGDEIIKQKAGAFVSLKIDGKLRGCIGTIEPYRTNLAKEIISNAISAATQDPRFPPVSREELDKISYSVDVIEKPEKVADFSMLDTKEYGVIVKSGYRTGVLLPDIEGVDSAEQQVSIALRKAGISNAEKYDLYRFKVTRHNEE
jgi:AmmeMemoRadiSam system protein A